MRGQNALHRSEGANYMGRRTKTRGFTKEDRYSAFYKAWEESQERVMAAAWTGRVRWVSGRGKSALWRALVHLGTCGTLAAFVNGGFRGLSFPETLDLGGGERVSVTYFWRLTRTDTCPRLVRRCEVFSSGGGGPRCKCGSFGTRRRGG